MGTAALSAQEVRFGRDVLPILSDRCFHCHGPDESDRYADLRLDVLEGATADLGGHAAIVPGDIGKSELIRRITTHDLDLQMPPSDSHRKPLTKKEVEVLKHWIEQGAKWGRHWAFEKPVRPPLPRPAANPVDAFIHARLAEEGLEPSARAPRHTLARRLALDLTGLPPTPDQVDALVADDSSAAYESLVEQCLSSHHYGERMAVSWLDAARYSDTDGFQHDATRSNWPWRDWVVQSFNQNMPFDRFTIEQFAGDLLPDATPEQKLATCFHRNHQTNGEGGRDPEESRIDYVIDRVNSVGTVWLGLTLECCQCHSHKFDPISQRDYYSLSAFFNSIDENGKAGRGAKPYMKYKSPHVEAAVKETEQVTAFRDSLLQQARTQARSELDAWLADRIQEVRLGFEPWETLHALSLSSTHGTKLKQQSDNAIQASGPNPKKEDYVIVANASTRRITGVRLEVLPHESHTEGRLARNATGKFVLTNFKMQVRRPGESQVRDIDFASVIADVEGKAKGEDRYGEVIRTLDDDPRNGWTIDKSDLRKPAQALFALAEPLDLVEGEQLVFVMIHGSLRAGANIGRFRLSVTDQPGNAVKSLDAMPMEKLAAVKPSTVGEVKDDLKNELFEQFLADHDTFQQARRFARSARQQLKKLKSQAGPLDVMVLSERKKPRATHVLQRGVWDQKGERVAESVPAEVLAWPAEKTRTRLDLAQWLVSRDNPLTARVAVNQLWQACFGEGLVRTPEDFGLQGEAPSHPDLLDWLAVEFMESGWDVKHVLRLIVTSQTYQQSSEFTPELLERDPQNRLLARGSRYRMPSWMIRDVALASSGLLNPRLGGPPIMPYQPKGVWLDLFKGRITYKPTQGPAQFRRTLYAFWRRSAAPTYLFDAAKRRTCEVRLRRTNTPLHALTLMNDLGMLEASRALAMRAVEESSDTDALGLLFRQVLSRQPLESERTILSRELAAAQRYYASNPQDAQRVLTFGQPELIPQQDHPRTAAYMVLASLILNLDEAMTRE